MISIRQSQVGLLGSLAAVGILALGCTGSVGRQGQSRRSWRGRPGRRAQTGDGHTPGEPGGGSNLPPPPPVNPAETTNLAGPQHLRRLTLLEYSNTIRDLLGVRAPAAGAAASRWTSRAPRAS